MHTMVVTWDTLSGRNAEYWKAQFQNRKREFVDQLGWDIPNACGVEMDQYDRAETAYVLAVEDGRLVGNARLLPTHTRARMGPVEFSYMLRDATLGLLDGIAPNIANYAPQSSRVWEMTRFQAETGRASAALFEKAFEFLLDRGVTETVAYTRSGFCNYLTRMGLPSEEMGPRFTLGGKPYSAIRTDLSNAVMHIRPEVAARQMDIRIAV